MSEKFSPKTQTEWNLKRGEYIKEYASYQEINAFLSFRGLSDSTNELSFITDNSRNKSRSSVNSVSVLKCINCIGSHSLSKCEKFLSLSVGQCSTLAREKRVCFNCLRSSHFLPKCPNKSRCMHYRRMHHSLLHLAEDEITNVTVDQTPSADDSKTQTVSNASSVLGSAMIADVQTARREVPRTFNVLLATAWSLYPLVETHLHYLAETWSRDVNRRNNWGGNFRRSSKDYRTSCWLCERMGIAPTIFELDSAWVTAYVLRFIENSKRKRNSQSGKELAINVSELRKTTQF